MTSNATSGGPAAPQSTAQGIRPPRPWRLTLPVLLTPLRVLAQRAVRSNRQHQRPEEALSAPHADAPGLERRLLLFTSRYQRFVPQQGAAVRTTVGAPRFPLAYPLAGTARLLMPDRHMLGLSQGEYLPQFRARLDDAGVAAIRDELRLIARAAGSDRLVLLCFCDLSAPPPDGWCHRRMFAAWWQERTGEAIPELAELPHPSLFD